MIISDNGMKNEKFKLFFFVLNWLLLSSDAKLKLLGRDKYFV